MKTDPTEIESLRTQAAPDVAVPTMDDAVAAADGTLHGAIDYWQKRALSAEEKLLARDWVLEDAAMVCDRREARANREDVRATCHLCAKDIRALKAAPTAAPQPQAPAQEPVAHLWQHGETGRTRIVLPDMIVDADASWQVVGPLHLDAAPQPAVAAGWVSVDDRLPEPDEPVLAHNGKWTGVAAWMSGEYLEPLERWQDEHREFIEMMGPAITHWMPLPPAPSTEGESRG